MSRKKYKKIKKKVLTVSETYDNIQIVEESSTFEEVSICNPKAIRN